MNYRRDIDGLRAVAVLSVILFHAGFGFVRGGYVGVDLFFVISGYLITTVIVSERMEGRFSLVNFYERRARRILPALFAVIWICLPLAWVTMVPFQLKDFAKSVLAVCLFSSNFLFWRESGYFQAATELKPLLHTWSLAIEEQFYLLLPLAILATWRYGRRMLVFWVSLTLVLSLALAQWAAHKGIVVANFYLMPTRAWELLLGSLAAIYVIGSSKKPSHLACELASALGAILIVYSIGWFDQATPFPSVMALIPTSGAVLVILFAQGRTTVGRLLSSRPLVGIGLISYSAYLWHQPLFAFARLVLPNTANLREVLTGLALGSIFLGWLTWYFIERPFRRPEIYSRRQIFVWSGLCSAILAAWTVPVILTDGVISRFPAQDHYLLSVNPTELGRYTERRSKQLEGKLLNAHLPGARIAIIGDSYAQDFINMIAESGALPTAQISTIPIAARCPKYIGMADVAQLYRQSGEFYDATYCEGVGNIRKSIDLARSANVIVLAALWRPWEAEYISETIAAFNLRDDQRLIVVGRKDFGNISPLHYLGKTDRERAWIENDISSGISAVNDILRRNLPKTTFLDLQNALCQSRDRCRIFTEHGELISFDGEHFTPEGARYAGQIVLPQLGLNKVN